MPPSPVAWMEWHLSLPGNEFLVDIEISYLMDPLNTIEFTEEDSPSLFANYDGILKIILGMAPTCIEDLLDATY